MTEPEFSDPNANLEPGIGLGRDADLDPDRRDLEAPAEDAFEQSMPASPAGERDEGPVNVDRDIEVNEWDAIEQAQVVDFDDDYR
ncbi:MAG TPA: hypothetical protein VGJ07_07800 [Rugosimonospora sp.]|jgi:hypothetical protein